MKLPTFMSAPCALLTILLSVASAENCCSRLQALYPDKTYFPLQLKYNSERTLPYFAAQSYAQPGCVFTAKNIQDVSNAVTLFHQYRCEYATRSGGHNPIPGWSNTNGGVLLSLSDMKDVTHDASANTVRFSAGCRWQDVYTVLDALGVGTMGGRDNTVGTGGFLLGGGISFYSNKYGWAADQILAYEVVYANGTIGTITQASYPDLFTAMKGAGSSFAIVTHFTQKTFPQQEYHAGFKFYPETSINRTLTALYDYSVSGLLTDTDSHIIPAITHVGPALANVAAFCFFYPEPLKGGEVPVFQPFNGIPFISNTRRDRRGISDISAEIGAPSQSGRRQSFTDISIVLDDPTVLHEISKAYTEAAAIPKILITGFIGSLIFYPLSSNFVAQGTANGKKNSMGLEETPAGQAGKTVMIVCINVTWLLQIQDTIVKAFLDDAFGRFKAIANAKGLNHPFQYMNYADGTQDVLAGYGGLSAARLRSVKAQVDPTNDFGTLIKGRYPIPSA